MQQVAANAGKLAGNEKAKLTVMAIFTGNVLLDIIIFPIFTGVGISLWYPILFQLFILVLVGIYWYRFYVFREGEKIQEYQSGSSDSFARYYYLRNLDDKMVLRVGKLELPMFEFINGSNMLVLQFKYGANNDSKSAQTLELLTKIIQQIGVYGLSHNWQVGTEDFLKSAEYDNYTRKLHNIDDLERSARMLDIVNHCTKLSREQSNVETLYLELRTKANYQQHDLSIVISIIFRLLSDYESAFRHIEVLDREGLNEYLRYYYKLAVIDYSLMRLRNGDDLEGEINKEVMVYQIERSDGKFYTDNDVLEQVMREPKTV